VEALAAWYPQLKLTHLVLVAASGTLFSLRALGVLAGARWPLRRGPRVASVAIDTLLLAAGATLWAVLGLDLGHSPWLAAKLVLLLLYIVLGSVALRGERSTAARLGFLLAAWAVFAAMVAIARTRDPWIWWHWIA
jgi:uncharacterized membrane protein SirB2